MKLFDLANKYCRQSDWKTLALLKCCLFAVGVMVGMLLPKAKRTPVLVTAALAFTASYIPLMTRFLALCKAELQK